ncbi:MAG: hypothetical protein KY462_02100 [Actinobacteria bacterium]|nr:hypothetical protein [Actinomycetota bacterium]
MKSDPTALAALESPPRKPGAPTAAALFAADDAPRVTLAERAARTDERNRDCRSCPAFTPAPCGLAYGWCRAHDMYVKLYHPPGGFYSQCQFKVLTRVVGAPKRSRHS